MILTPWSSKVLLDLPHFLRKTPSWGTHSYTSTRKRRQWEWNSSQFHFSAVLLCFLPVRFWGFNSERRTKADMCSLKVLLSAWNFTEAAQTCWRLGLNGPTSEQVPSLPVSRPSLYLLPNFPFTLSRFDSNLPPNHGDIYIYMSI